MFIAMNKVILCLAFLGYASAARLDHLQNNQYLPPQGNAVERQQNFPGPKSGQQQGAGQYQPSNQYGAPSGQGAQQQYSGQGSQPSNQYGAPSGQQQDSQPSNQYGAPSGQQQYSNEQLPTQRSPLADVPILRLDSDNPGDGTYRYNYETGNDIAAQEEGSAQSGWNKAQGSYRFVSPEGQNFEVTYTADENGYVPQGAHLPTPPPIPEEILKSLELIRQAEASGNIIEGAYQPEGDDGQYHESHDEGQYNHQQPSEGYQQPSGGYQQPSGGYQQQQQQQQQPSGVAKNQPQGFQKQPIASNGGYRY
ncbi:unnamed protein product [Ceutorhynchus assimilis]|uniref:Uncharacterized protein n=1 Tax=Ceutorhynchus assimilis TaxID=467358 RepID=A0A9P0GKM5_9CUCU|nr:unnamed protein product [Ceutorhynchus assimilis]